MKTWTEEMRTARLVPPVAVCSSLLLSSAYRTCSTRSSKLQACVGWGQRMRTQIDWTLS